jgi:hypothetical protein
MLNAAILRLETEAAAIVYRRRALWRMRADLWRLADSCLHWVRSSNSPSVAMDSPFRRDCFPGVLRTVAGKLYTVATLHWGTAEGHLDTADRDSGTADRDSCTADRDSGTADRNFGTADTANSPDSPSDWAHSTTMSEAVFVGLRRTDTNSLLRLVAAVAASFPAEAAQLTAEELYSPESLVDTSDSSFRKAATGSVPGGSAWDRTQWGCRVDDCCHRDPRVSFEMQSSLAEAIAEAFGRSADDSARSAECLLLRSDPPMARDMGSSVGNEVRTGLLLEGQAVGVLIVGSIGSPIAPTLLLYAAALRRKYCRSE